MKVLKVFNRSDSRRPQPLVERLQRQYCLIQRFLRRIGTGINGHVIKLLPVVVEVIEFTKSRSIKRIPLEIRGELREQGGNPGQIGRVQWHGTEPRKHIRRGSVDGAARLVLSCNNT